MEHSLRNQGFEKSRFHFIILYFPIAHNALCLPPKFCGNYCFGNVQSSQENLKTIVYAKFGGQTKCIVGNWKIENMAMSHKDWELPKSCILDWLIDIDCSPDFPVWTGYLH